MPAPTLFRRLFLAQLAGAAVLLLVAGSAFYVERNRTIARLMAERWAPALRAAAGLPAPADGGAPSAPGAVRTADARPADAIRGRPWAPRVATLRETLRERGVPAVDIVFSPGRPRPTTWVEVAAPGAPVRWLGFDDDVVEPRVLGRGLMVLVLGLAALAAASGFVARRVAGPLEALRRRIESHDGGGGTPLAGASPGAAGTQEIAAIDQAWRALRGRLAEHESERALLLAGVSHDLRSPLARIRMAAELLPDDPALSERRASIVRNVEVADRLVASFLDYVRAGELPLDARVDIAAVARRQVEMRELPDDALALEAPARLVLPRANELLLERLVANLVDNALTHGRPPVRVRLTQAGDEAILDVEDHGPGMPPESRARMTQAFARGDASRSTPGAGLGLAVVQQVVRRCGGTLSFDSEGPRQRVRVRVPLR